MKTLGILGGMGPLATVKLFEKIVMMTDADKDQEHIHTLVDSNTKIPDRTAYIWGQGEDPLPELVKSAKRLENAGADFLIMPCNTAHYHYDEIKNSISIPFLNMIDETAKYIKGNLNLNKVGLLATAGTFKSNIYKDIFNKYEIELILPKEDEYKYLMELIYNIKMNIFDNELTNVGKVIENIKKKNVELFVIGCTELSVAAEIYNLGINYIDPMNIIAMSAIEYAGGKLKKMQ